MCMCTNMHNLNGKGRNSLPPRKDKLQKLTQVIQSHSSTSNSNPIYIYIYIYLLTCLTPVHDLSSATKGDAGTTAGNTTFTITKDDHIYFSIETNSRLCIFIFLNNWTIPGIVETPCKPRTFIRGHGPMNYLQSMESNHRLNICFMRHTPRLRTRTN